MAYRKIHDDFWTDPDIEELTPEQKFFYLYLITNPNVNQIGLYEFSVKRACFETGYNTDTVCKLLDTFENMGKIKRSSKTKEILVIKFYWHNKSNSPKVIKHVEGLLEAVKDTSLIQYIYGMDIASQEEEEKEEEKKKGVPSEAEYEIPKKEQVEEYFRERGMMLESDIPLEAENFINHFSDCDWKNSKGKRIQFWRRQAGTWVNKYFQYNEKRIMRSKEENKNEPIIGVF